jgi:hypothetical protein
MDMINRCILIVKAKQPFLLWLQSLPDPANLTLEQINRDNAAYLLPEYDDDSDRKKLLRRCVDLIFEEQLSSWWRDETAWPAKRDMKTFMQWFDVEFHSVVLDLVDKPLLREE